MAALAQVLPYYLMLMPCQKLIKGPADQSQWEVIGGPAVAKDLNLDLDGEAPRGRDWRLDMVQTKKESPLATTGY